MKDFHDIWYLANTFEFDGDSLSNALEKTTNNRGTVYEKDSFDRIIRLMDNKVIVTRWGVFIKKQSISIEFSKAIEVIDLFLRDVADSNFKEEQFKKTWRPDELRWK
jgi:hypothetical protein